MKLVTLVVLLLEIIKASVVSDVYNISHHAIIHYLGIKGLTPKEIHEDMVVTLGENSHSYSMVKKWDAELKLGRDSLGDAPIGEG